MYAIITPTEKLKIITAFDIGFQNDVVNNKKSTWYAPAILVGYDWHEKFVRLSYDPNANFGVQNMWRFSLGTRF